MIGQMIKKWLQLFEIQEGGDRHLECLQLDISDVIDKRQIKVAIFALNFMMIEQ